MATNLKNLSQYNIDSIPNADDMKFGIVVAEWNYEITSALAEGAIETFLKQGVSQENIIVKHVPGSFELTMGAQLMAEYTDVDAIVCLGCVYTRRNASFRLYMPGCNSGNQSCSNGSRFTGNIWGINNKYPSAGTGQGWWQAW